jgi:FkbM family methyltransferase
MLIKSQTYTSIFATLGKRIAPKLANLLENPIGIRFLRYIELYINVLQGKGAVGAWNVASEIQAVTSLINSDFPVIFDVGANVGQWSEDMSKSIMPRKGHFYCFEPLPSNFLRLEKCKNKNKADWRIFQIAVGDRNAPTMLFGPKSSQSTVATIYKTRPTFTIGEEFEELQVEQFTLDSIIVSEKIKTIDILKLDIEGHEMAALLGAENSLREGIIKVISFEFGATQLGPKIFFRDFWDFFSDLGYKMSRVGLNGRPLSVLDYYEDLEYFRGGTTYLAIKK